MGAKRDGGELADSTVPLTVLMTFINEEHNMEAVLDKSGRFHAASNAKLFPSGLRLMMMCPS